MPDDHLDATSATPLFDQLAARLRAAIVSGQIPADHKMETQESLTERFGVSRKTAQRALAILQAEGLVVWAPGKGLYSAQANVITKARRGRKQR